MQLVARPWITAGVAVAGASVIAVTPVTPPALDIQVPAIQLSAAADPTGWLDVFGTAFTNISELGGQWLATPFPVLQQVIVNQMGYADTLSSALQEGGQALGSYLTGDAATDLQPLLALGIEQLTSGDIGAGVSTFAQALLVDPLLAAAYPLMTGGSLYIPGDIVTNLGTMLHDAMSIVSGLNIGALGSIAFGAMGPLLSPILAFGDSAEAIYDGVAGGDPLAALGALANMPAALTGAFLNGYGTIPISLGPLDFPAVPMGGLLSPAGTAAALDLLFGNPVPPVGALASLFLNLPHVLAESIGWDGVGNPLDVLGAGASLAAIDPSLLLGGFDPSLLLGSFDPSLLLEGLDPSLLLGSFDPGALADIPAMLLGLLGF